MFGLTPYNRKNEGLTRKNDLWDLRNVFDGFFTEPFFTSVFDGGNIIRADIRQTEKEYIIEAEIPGTKKEDIKLDLREDTLTISVEHNEEIKEERDQYICRERRVGSLRRSFYVENVENEKVTAKYDNGVLTICLPKSEGENTRKHHIEIE